MNKNKSSYHERAQQIEQRKREHIEVSLTKGVEYHKTTMFEDVILFHNALPELDRNQVDTSTEFLGHKFNAPIMITGMIGGAKEAERINKNIASACQSLGIGMGLGSMKAMIVEPSLAYSYQVRDVAPDIFLAGNIGANDLKHFPVSVLKEAMESVGANILAVHLNPAQELVQKEGAAEFAGVLDLITKYSKQIPIYVKEVGQGISGEVAARLAKTDIKAIDVAGSGGTNWIDIEYIRRGVEKGALQNWGIPTALALRMTRQVTDLPLIATGGIRRGEEVVKAITLGVDICALGLPTLHKGNVDTESTENALAELIKEIGDIMFLLGIQNVDQLRKYQSKIVGRLRDFSEK